MKFVISAINTSTTFLEQNFNFMFKDFLTTYKYNMNNNSEFQKIITQKILKK